MKLPREILDGIERLLTEHESGAVSEDTLTTLAKDCLDLNAELRVRYNGPRLPASMARLIGNRRLEERQ